MAYKHNNVGLKRYIRYLVNERAAVPDEVEDGGEAARLEDGARLPLAHQLQHLDALLRQVAARPAPWRSINP